MRTRGRVLLGASLIFVSASLALVACVGDDPTSTTNSSDASTSGDSTSSADTAVTDTGSTSTDSGDAAAETFDGSNPTCNGLFPQDAPMPATIECDGSAPGSVTGGPISLGRYYLVDEKYPAGMCPPDLTGYSDVIDISDAGDGGFTVNAALNGSLNERLTLAWAVNGATFSQYNACPGSATHVNNVGYNATSTTLTYFLLEFGNLTYQKF
jgi:hypothetical protein